MDYVIIKFLIFEFVRINKIKLKLKNNYSIFYLKY